MFQVERFSHMAVLTAAQVQYLEKTGSGRDPNDPKHLIIPSGTFKYFQFSRFDNYGSRRMREVPLKK